MDFKCDELILGKKDADSRALTANLQQLYDLPIACHTLQSGRRVLLPERSAVAHSGW